MKPDYDFRFMFVEIYLGKVKLYAIAYARQGCDLL